MTFRLPNPRLTTRAVTVLAVLAAVAMFALAPGGGSVANAQEGVPGKPKDLTGRLLQFGSAELDWNDVEGAETYEAQYWDNTDGSNNFWADPPSVEYDGSSAVLSGLPNQQVFYFQVRARDPVGPSEWSDYIRVTNPGGRGWLVNICGRTQQVQDAILAKIPNVSDCANVTDRDLSYFQSDLDLDDSGITTLQAGDFQGLSRMPILKLSRNNLSALPDGIFDDLVGLKSLRLDINHLSELSDDVFDDLSKLEYLNLGNNGLSELPAGVFDNLSNLRDLYLGFRWEHNIPDATVYPENTLDDLPDGALGNLSKLWILSLSDNNLSELPDGVFTGLTDLSRVNLIGNPGATFTVKAELEQDGSDAVVVKVAEGAPFDMLVTLSAEGGTLSSTTVTVEGGSDSSDPVTVTPTGEGSTEVTVNVESAAFRNYRFEHTRGIQAGTGVNLTLSLINKDPTLINKDPNSRATGAPTISGTAGGTAQVGQTLTASTSGISDADGLTNVTYSYQWLSDDAEIDGATSSTYTLQSSDDGKIVKVRVSFTDDAGNKESLTSDGTLATRLSSNDSTLSALTLSGTDFGTFDPATTSYAASVAYSVTQTTVTPTLNDDGASYAVHLDGVADDDGVIPLAVGGNTITVEVTAENGINTSTYTVTVNRAPKPAPICDRTQQVQNAILAEIPDVSDCADVNAHHLRDIRTLKIVNAGITALQSGDFRGLSDLFSLDLSKNSLSSLPDNVFEGLDSLEILTLTNNDLDALRRGMFGGLGSLERLTLDGNELSELPDDVFDDLTKLFGLYLSRNQFTALPTISIRNIDSLRWLGMDQNDINTLSDDALDGLDLYGLILHSNGLGALPEDVFDSVPNLWVLDLSDNELSALPDGTFEGMSKLHTLILSSNPGAPFTITAELERQGDNVVVVKVAQGAPIDMQVTLSAQGGTLSATTVTVEGGSLSSAPITVTPEGDGQVTVGMQSASLGIPGSNVYYIIGGLHIGWTSIPVITSSASPNNPATGAPAISGAAQVGQTLTADTAGIADADGLTNVSYSYQWLSSRDTEIEGATSSTYTPQSSDKGKVIKVRVTFTDDGGSEETLTSAATAAVAASPDSGPAVAIGLSPSASVDEGTEIALTMSFAHLESDSDTDYIFRADVLNADGCEGSGMGRDRYMYKVDEDPEVRTGAISTSCAPGDYTVEVSVSSPGNVELASATADFTVAAPAQQQQLEPPSTDATLSGLDLSGVDFGAFDSTTTGYTASVANGVDETTVTPTTNDDGATYEIKLGGVADADRTVSLSVGANVITVEVTAEDGNTIKTYTITVTRDAPPAPGPAVAVELSLSGSVEEGTEIDLTMSFSNLESDSDTSDTDYIFRADVVNADGCEGGGMGVDRYMYKVDEEPEVRAGTISTSCAPGDYTVEVSISSPGNLELASATADFTVNAPTEQQQQPEPPSTDATLSGLTLSDVTLAFASSTTEYTASVANDVDETTVTPTVNNDGATYAIKLGGMTDADGVIPLAVGGNVITIEVTAEDGNTAKTYTVTVTRAAPPLSADATLSSLGLSGVPFTFASDTTSYDVNVANGVDQTTVTATVNDGGATYAIKLGGVAHADGVVPLTVGSNAITVEVTAEDGATTKTYTVTVTRADPPPPEPVEPEPESTGERGAWLEQNPENKPFVGEWQHFTLRGNGLDKVDLSVNVIGFGGAPSSTGAVGYATASPLPAAGEVCGDAYYSGYQMSVDATFSLVGCREGTVVIELLDPGNDWALLKRYTVTVNAGP